MVPINYFAVLTSVVAMMAVGFVWYGPLFGKQWMALTGFSPDRMSASEAKKSYMLTALGSLLMAYVLAHSIIFAGVYLNMTGFMAGIDGAFWSWIGFVAPVTLGTVIWDRKPWKLWILNNGYWLVGMLVMGVILGMWS